MAIFNRTWTWGWGRIGTLWRLALPSMFSMFFHTLFLLWTTVLSRGWENPPCCNVAYLSIVFVVFALVNEWPPARHADEHIPGQRQERRSQRIRRRALMLVLIMSAPVVPLLFRPWSNSFFSLLGGSGDVLSESYRYAFWMVLATPMMSFSLLADAFSGARAIQ
jgi:Na+-driven multidrug efflux pump